MMMKTLSTIFLTGLLAGCSSTKGLDVVENFDAGRYMGTWYEAVRYPHGFEKGMSNVSATYSENADGTIRVVNRGFVDQKKKWKSITGTAKYHGDPGRGWLKVSFFKPFYASYKIIYLDDAYTEAIVTGPTYSYFWILTREKNIPAQRLDELINRAVEHGFDKEKMIRVAQDINT